MHPFHHVHHVHAHVHVILHLGERLSRLAEGGLRPSGVVRLLRFVYHLRHLVNGLRRLLTVLPALLHHLVHSHHLLARPLLLARISALLSHNKRGEHNRQREAHDDHHLALFQSHSPSLSLYNARFTMARGEGAGREAFEEVIRDSKIWYAAIDRRHKQALRRRQRRLTP